MAKIEEKIFELYNRYERKFRTKGKIRYRKEFLQTKKQYTQNQAIKFYDNAINTLEVLRQEALKVNSYKAIPSSKKQKGDTLVIQLSDWHVGRIVKDEIGNIIYDENIFKNRVEQLMEEMLKLVDKYIRKGTPIRDAVIISTGDIADGAGIFATQETMQELSPPFQVMSACKAIQSLILALLERNLSVYFYGVKGNHGEIRVNGKNRDPNANWDLMIYMILDFWNKTVIKNNKVKISYSELDYLNFEIQGWNYHARHIAPQQSETSAGKAKFLGWARKHNFDALVYGHYHHFGVFDRSNATIFRGGSLPGSDEFSETLAEESSPTQLLWGVNAKRPLTFLYTVDLGKKVKNERN